jgi:hypothetical protein
MSKLAVLAPSSPDFRGNFTVRKEFSKVELSGFKLQIIIGSTGIQTRCCGSSVMPQECSVPEINSCPASPLFQEHLVPRVLTSINHQNDFFLVFGGYPLVLASSWVLGGTSGS